MIVVVDKFNFAADLPAATVLECSVVRVPLGQLNEWVLPGTIIAAVSRANLDRLSKMFPDIEFVVSENFLVARFLSEAERGDTIFILNDAMIKITVLGRNKSKYAV